MRRMERIGKESEGERAKQNKKKKGEKETGKQRKKGKKYENNKGHVHIDNTDKEGNKEIDRQGVV